MSRPKLYRWAGAFGAAVACLGLALATSAPGAAQTRAGQTSAADTGPAASPIDYAREAAWVCRPNKAAVCTTGLDAMAINGEGRRTYQSFTPAADPPIDCFYVYPTISQEAGAYSDMAQSPEVEEVVRAQAGRLTSRCRVFAPLYRQITMAGLRHDMATGEHLDWRPPYHDVLAAWRQYLAHDNHGRGVVLIGHSQGAIVLQRLIAEELDGQPAERLLVSAFLAGDPSLAVPEGRSVGGAFHHVPLCGSAGATGCVYVWGSYLSDDASPDRHFGRDPGDGMVAACVNPAAPQGGPGELTAYLPKPGMAPQGDPPWIEVVGQLSARCVADRQGDVLRVTVEPGRYTEILHAGLQAYVLGAGWGLHRLDLSLPQGDILDLVAAETRTWQARARR